MQRRISRKAQKVGQAPGTLVHTGERRVESVRMRLIDFGPDAIQEREVDDVAEAFPYPDTDSVTWLNVDGLHDTELVGRLGERFGLHPLVQEDILSTGQRPKVEDYGSYLFLVLRMLSWDAGSKSLHDEQLSLVLGSSWVLTFQERSGDVLDPLRQRLRAGRGRARAAGPDYLAYAVVDSVVDHYFVVLERLGEHIDGLEGEVVFDPGPETVREIYRLKREMLFLRRSVWPLREVLGFLQREESSLVGADTRIFVRDAYDHTIQVIDTAETLRELVAGLLDTYLSSVSNRMNEIMKVLTIMATIFIPLTFIAGIYGMNFEWMPELGWRPGYPAALALMAAVAGVLVLYFRRKGWI